MSEPVLIVEDVGAVRVLTMNRPDKRNALDFALTEALVTALEAAEADETVRALVLTGSGTAFCAGADRGEFKMLTPENAPLVERRAELTMRLHALPPASRLPVVAAVNGFAMGGGAGLAGACDYVLASDKARMGYPEVSHGIVAAIVMAALVRDVGRKAALDLVLTGRQIDAAEMLRLGLATAIVPHETLMGEAMRVAGTMAGFDPVAVAETKRLCHAVADLTLAEAHAEGRRVNTLMRGFRAAATGG